MSSFAENADAINLDRLMKFIERVKDKLDKNGRKMGVESYSIGMSITGPSISVRFKPKD